MSKSGNHPPEVSATDTEKGDSSIALNYMQMARTEILSRVEATSKTLIAYVGAASAVMTFFYNATLKDLTSGDRFLLSCAVLAYLSVGAMWVIKHQETMINSLARYQKFELKSSLPSRPHMWELSGELKKGDGKVWSTGTIVVQAAIILVPILCTFGGALHLRNVRLPESRFLQCAIGAAKLYDLTMVGIMIWDRLDLRASGKPGTYGTFTNPPTFT